MTSLMLLKSILYTNALRKTKTRKKVKSKKVSAATPKTIDMKMCRICNVEVGDIPIFNNFVQPNIPEEIKNFSGVTMSKSDSLPKHMCQNCLDLLNACVMFREMCQSTNKKMVELSIKKEITSFDIANGQQSSDDNSDNNFNNDNTFDKDYEVNSDDDSYHVPSPVFSDKSDLWGCPECNKEFEDLKSYSNHLKDCNNQVIEPPKSPKKPKRRKAETRTSFLCDICGKTARSKASLSVHMGTHENIFPFKCDVCPYRGRTMDLLRVHQRSHLVDKPYKCTQCPKATTTASNLAKHMRHVHSTTRPYKCHYCDKAFSYQHDMNRHIKDIHLRQGTVECDVCYKKFNTKKILQGHRYKIHKIKGERSGRLPSYLQCQADGGGSDTQTERIGY